MDVLIGVLIFAAGIAVFVAMVRRTNAKARDLADQVGTSARYSHRPQLLTKEQRKALNPKLRHSQKKSPESPPAPLVVKPAKKVTRAIRTGWSLGQVEFSYKDSKGDVTYRSVTVHSITNTYIKGECHDRQSERTFHIDRIIGDLTDCETGEIMTPKKWAKENSV